MSDTQSDGLPLPGLDGTNPLGFLAALGLLDILFHEQQINAVQLSWKQSSVGVLPVYFTDPGPLDAVVLAEVIGRASRQFSIVNDDKLVQERDQASPKAKSGKPKWKDKLRFPPVAYESHLKRLLDSSQLRYSAALACPAATELVDKILVAARTPFDFTAGNQAFIAMAEEAVSYLANEADVSRQLTTICPPVKGVSLRWDPADEARRYAYSYYDPQDNSNNPILTYRVANGLAVMGLAAFPLLPVASRLKTTCWDRDDDGTQRFAWPLWRFPLSTSVIASLLRSTRWSSGEPQAGGTAEYHGIYFSRVVKPSDRYRNFTRAERVA